MKSTYRSKLFAAITVLSLNSLVSPVMASWEEDFAPPAKKNDSPPMVMMNPQDPYESYNRKMFAFNMAFHDAIGEPVANAYLNYVPQPAQTGVQNFFSNLGMPLNVMNSFLQGKGQEGFEGIMRFTLNSTFGLFGLLDIATPAGLELKKEDFGQTLAVWGVWDKASFVMLPFVGPYTTRSLVGWGVDSYSDPLYQIVDSDDVNRPALAFGDAFISYTKAAPLIEELRRQPDPYIFMRESYLQYRTNVIYDGHPPQPKLDDFDFE